MRQSLLRIAAGCILIIVAVAIMTGRLDWEDSTRTATVVPPTCTENGYTLYQDKVSGATTVEAVVEATGHSFGELSLVEESDGISCTVRRRVCAVCGEEELQMEYPALPLPMLKLYGSLEGIGKKDEVPLTAAFEDPGQTLSVESYATLKYQGHASLQYDKKNYTLKFYADETREEKLKLALHHWNKENKYILKANYIDLTQCRNLVCADIWAELCAGRESVAEELKSLSNYGAVDGFPVAVYLNDIFHGLYTMNLHKDDDLFGMKEGERHAIMIINEDSAPEALFMAPAAFGDSTPWEVEYCGTEDSAWAKDQLNELIDFVMTADDAAFHAELTRYLDVDAAIDYLLAIYALGLVENGRQDLVLATYGGVWIPSLYDMENAFGLRKDGDGSHAPTEFLPQKTPGGWDSATGSLLWDRLLNVYTDEIRARYAVLRRTTLSPETICARVDAFTAAIPAEVSLRDLQLYPRASMEWQSVEQLKTYTTERIAALDQIFY